MGGFFAAVASCLAERAIRPVVILAALAACAGLASPATAAPINDNFADAVDIRFLPKVETGSNVGATLQAGEPATGAPAGATVWWKFRATAAGRHVVTTDGSNFDTIVEIYTGAGVAALTLVAADNDGGTGNTSRAVFNATAGTTYHIRVRGVGNAQRNITLGVFGPSPANDDFANRVTIAGYGTVIGSNVGASLEADEPLERGNSIWWKFTPTTSGPLRVNTFGSEFDTVLQVSTGTAVGALTVIGTNNDEDSLSNRQSELVFTATAGTTYNISVRGSSWELPQGKVVLTVTPGGTGTAMVVAAVTPVARATSGGLFVTTFASVLNAGTTLATGCRPAMPPVTG